MVFKATFSGIDGCGKSTTIYNLSRLLAERGFTVAHTRRPSYIDIPGKERKYFGRKITETIDFLHGKADEQNSKLLVGMVNMVYGRIWTAMENHAIREYNPDFILAGRDPLVDHCVYSQYYFPFTKGIELKKRVDMTNLIVGKRKVDLMFYFDISPEEACLRIQKRIEKEKREGAKERAKWCHMHENIADLTFLRDKYEEMLNFLNKEGKRKIIRIDALQSHERVIQETFNHIIQEFTKQKV